MPSSSSSLLDTASACGSESGNNCRKRGSNAVTHCVDAGAVEEGLLISSTIFDSVWRIMLESSVEIDDDLLGIGIGLDDDDLRPNCRLMSADGLIIGEDPAQHDPANL